MRPDPPPHKILSVGVPPGPFESFFRQVLSDESLQEKLRDIEDLDVFIVRVVELGAEQGFTFTAADVAAALSQGRRAWIERTIG